MPTGILFDSDMGRNIDAAIALAMVYNLGAKGQLTAVGVSVSNLDAAAFCDAVARFYKGDQSLMGSGTRSALPVGLAENGPKLENTSMLSAPLGMKKPDGSPVFPHGVKAVRDTADVSVLFRNGLLTQKDGEGTVIVAGPATDMARTLAFKGYKEVIAAKAGRLIWAAGAYPNGPADGRVKADIASARQLLAQWPGPIVAVGTEVGAAVPYPGRSIEGDFSWAPAHPVVEAYRAFHAMPYDAPGQAMAAVLFAANQKEDYFQLSETGNIEVLDDGRTRFAPSGNGRHRYLRVDPAQRERVIGAFVELARAKPAVPGRGRAQ
jgi:hypothetical protein